MTRRSRRISVRRLSRQQAIVLVAVIVALVVWRWWSAQPEGGEPGANGVELEPGVYGVERVVDGDTLVLANQCRVRLIGADTPETVDRHRAVEPWGPEATRFTKEFVAGGEVRLEFDGPRQDKYQRYLAYVWVGDRMLNEELIRAGLAAAKTGYPYSARMKARFREAEAEARAAGRGIWSH
jgi:endonuclease YncB( thermonuclease family)